MLATGWEGIQQGGIPGVVRVIVRSGAIPLRVGPEQEVMVIPRDEDIIPLKLQDKKAVA